MGFKLNPLTGFLDLTGTIPSSTVLNPALSSTDNAIVRFDGTTGTRVQNSLATLDDSGNLTATSFIGSGTSLTGVEKTANKGAANGYASLDSGAKVPLSQLPSTLMEFQGNWNPNTNSPTLVDGTGTTGFTYWVSAAKSGAVSGLNDASMTNFQVGDLVIYNGSAWVLVTPAAGVQSVNGGQGAVTVNAINQLTGDVTAGPASGSQSAVATIPNSTITNAKIANSTIDLTTKVTGLLPYANGGTNASTSWTQGSVLFAGASALAQNNSRLFWDNTNFRLGINTASPATAALDVRPSSDATGGSVIFTSADGSKSISMGTANNGVFRIVNQMSGSHTLLAITGSQDALTWGQAAKAAFMAIKPGGATPTASPTMTLEQASSQSGAALEIWDNAGTAVKQASITHAGLGTFSNLIDSGLTANTALTANASKQLTSSATTDTELGYVSGVTSAIQTQLNNRLVRSAGDIDETSFTAADNQVAAANVTGFAFANATVRSFNAMVSVTRGATYAFYQLQGVQRASDWALTQSLTGDTTGLTFTITTAGQIQYVSSSTGSTATLKFRALTTSA